MRNRIKKIEDFLSVYEASFNRALSEENALSLETVQELSSGCFIESNPHKVNCGKCEDLLKKTQENITRYKNNGIKKARIHSKEITSLDDYHAMVKVQWHFSADQEFSRGELIVLTIFYLLRTIKKDIKIFGYISTDEQRAMQEHEVMAAEETKDLVYDL